MSRQSLEQILPLVRHPSHYLGTEIHGRRKNHEKIRFRVALAFPDLYEVAMSHVGIQILYHILNARDEVWAERVFAPAPDLEEKLRSESIPLLSLETRTPLSSFDMVGFSLLYELNYTGILTMLDLSGIPFWSGDRDASHPLIVAGGPCTFNPEPLAGFFDAMVVGDGERVVLEMVDAWLAWKKAGSDREGLLRKWSKIQGVYIPALFEAREDDRGFQILAPHSPEYTTVRKALVPDLTRVPYPDRPVIPFGSPIHDRLSLEICRGCTRGCRFCQAGMIYRPVRERSPADVLSLAEKTLANTGYEDISLLSLSTGDYSAIEGLMEQLMNRCAPEKIAVSLPSLRVGSLTPSLMNQIKRVRKTGFTIAPEAGTERLRRVINKNITEEDLRETVRNAFDLGWNLIKLYFMIGLPTETDADVDAIVKLVRRLQNIRPSGRRSGSITVSVSTFIPKGHTPFQWASQMSLEESTEKIRALRDSLRGRGLRFKWQNPQMSLLEGLWARGDRRLGLLLVKAYEMGCRLDGWSDYFQYGRWRQALESTGIDPGFYTTRTRDLEEPLPWDHVDPGVSRAFLVEEWKKALEEKTTGDCRTGDCTLCGVCDFDTVEPVTFEMEEGARAGPSAAEAQDGPPFKALSVSYEKRGPAKYFGHLELVTIFRRAFRRARIPLRFTEGFHPVPKMSFGPALPVGTESLEERFTIQVPLHVSRETVLSAVNAQLPDGLALAACDPKGRSTGGDQERIVRYTVTLRQETFSMDRLKNYLRAPAWPMTKTNKKGRSKTFDLKERLKKIELLGQDRAHMILKEKDGAAVRPGDALSSIFGLSEEALKLADFVKGPAGPQGHGKERP